MISFGSYFDNSAIELRIGAEECIANPGIDFNLPTGYERGSEESYSLYGGSEMFKILEYEGYKVKF